VPEGRTLDLVLQSTNHGPVRAAQQSPGLAHFIWGSAADREPGFFFLSAQGLCRFFVCRSGSFFRRTPRRPERPSPWWSLTTRLVDPVRQCTNPKLAPGCPSLQKPTPDLPAHIVSGVAVDACLTQRLEIGRAPKKNCPNLLGAGYSRKAGQVGLSMSLSVEVEGRAACRIPESAPFAYVLKAKRKAHGPAPWNAPAGEKRPLSAPPIPQRTRARVLEKANPALMNLRLNLAVVARCAAPKKPARQYSGCRQCTGGFLTAQSIVQAGGLRKITRSP